MSERYHHSEDLLERALKTIPLGSQTFSKSKTQYPMGVSPFFIQCGKGSRVWDVDGNEYVDFINSLAAITFGYCDPDVDAAVRAQLEEGVIFSLPHPIEMQVAELIVKLVPCAEKVRFGKMVPMLQRERYVWRARLPIEIMSRSAAIMAGRTGTLAQPCVIAAFQRQPAIFHMYGHITTLVVLLSYFRNILTKSQQ